MRLQVVRAISLILGLTALGAIAYLAVGRSPGPLEGFSDGGEQIFDLGDSPLQAGDLITIGCQVLTNPTDTDLVVVDVRLEMDSSPSPLVFEGPLYKVLTDDDVLLCSDVGRASIIAGVESLTDDLTIRPGEQVQILHTLRYGGGDVEKVLGYTVDYRQGDARHRKSFNFETWLCADRSLCS